MLMSDSPARRHAWRRVRRTLATCIIGVVALVVAGDSPWLIAADRRPRTPDGRPDLQGLWLNDTATPLERAAAFGDRATMTEAEATAYESRYQLDRTVAISRDKDFELDVAGDLDTYEPGHLLPGRRTSMITAPANGRVPALTPAAASRLAERTAHLNDHYAENPEDLTFAERCLIVANASVPPMLPTFYNNIVQIVQTTTTVALVSEQIHDVRTVSLTRREHVPASLQLWKGDSIGRWDGDTLVVDTTNFSERTTLRGSTAGLHLVERFRLTDADTLAYSFTVDDAAAFTQTWTADSQLTRTAGPMFEYACHEGNYSLPFVLRGRRFQENAAGQRGSAGVVR